MFNFNDFEKNHENDLNLKLGNEGDSYYANNLINCLFGTSENLIETDKHDLFIEMIYHAKQIESHMLEARVIVEDRDDDVRSFVSISAPIFTINGLLIESIKESFDFLVANADSVIIRKFMDEISIDFMLQGTREFIE